MGWDVKERYKGNWQRGKQNFEIEAENEYFIEMQRMEKRKSGEKRYKRGRLERDRTQNVHGVATPPGSHEPAQMVVMGNAASKRLGTSEPALLRFLKLTACEKVTDQKLGKGSTDEYS